MATHVATAARETFELIGSDQVEGTAVYGARGDHLGSIERIMINKHSGQVAYAVLRCGGFQGSTVTTIRSPGPPSAMTPP